MKLVIITHVVHKKKGHNWYAYQPYVREMNLWLKNVSVATIVAPISTDKITPIDISYQTNSRLQNIPNFNLLTLRSKINSFFKIPIVCFRIYRAMRWADHIHLRCPGNIGLLGCLVQIVFPSKKKTIKYAGNWDSKSKQPWSYKLQKWLLSNTLLTRNAKVMVYGDWSSQSKNIVPFFTATYSEKEGRAIEKKDLTKKIRFIYVGKLHFGKQPLLSIKVIQDLIKRGYKVQLDMYGDGEERESLELYIKTNNLANAIILHGNKSSEEIKQAYKEAHFLIFISRSEGWPKVVAEAMYWGCIPITSRVSCVPWMLEEGKRGLLVNSSKAEIVSVIGKSIENKEKYYQMSLEAKNWSQKYTLEYFDNEIQKLINDAN